jgi:hypothetical protein
MSETRSRRLGSPRPVTPPRECENRTPPSVRAAVVSQPFCGEKAGGVRTWPSRHAPTTKGCFYDHGFRGGSQGPHPAGGARGAGTLWPGVSRLWRGQGRVLSAARLPTAEVPAGCPAVRSGGVVLDSAVAVPPLREAVHRLPTLSPCRGSGLSSRRCWRRRANIWEPSTPIVRQ